MRTIVKSIVVMLAVVGTAASAAAAETRPTPGKWGGGAAAPGGAAAAPRWISCAVELPEPLPGGGADALTLPPLDDGFAATSAIFCGIESESGSDGGTYQVATESRADDIAALVSALRLPSEPRTEGPCVAMLPSAPWFTLLDDQGRWVRPGVPTGRCGFMRVEAQQAIDGLTLTRVRTRVLRQVESPAAVAAGCAQSWKDVIAIDTTTNPAVRAGTRGRDPLAGATQIRVCGYVSTNQEGRFNRGGMLPADRRARLSRALSKAGPARDCATPASRFAVLLVSCVRDSLN